MYRIFPHKILPLAEKTRHLEPHLKVGNFYTRATVIKKCRFLMQDIDLLWNFQELRGLLRLLYTLLDRYGFMLR